MNFISKLKNLFQFKKSESIFTNIEKEMYNGNYSKADELLENTIKSTNLVESEKFEYFIIKAYITENLGEPDKAEQEISQKIEEMEKLSENKSQLANLYIVKAYCLFDLGKIEESDSALQKGMELFNPTIVNQKTNELNGNIYFLKGKIYVRTGELEKSIEAYEKSLEFRKEIENYTAKADTFYDLGKLLSGLMNPEIVDKEKAIDYLLKAIDLYKQLNNKAKLLGAYNNIGTIYSLILHNKDKSLEYYLLSAKLLEGLGEKFIPQLGILSYNIGSLYMDKGELNTSLEYLEKAGKIFDDIGIKDKKGQTLNVIASIYEIKGDIKISLDIYEEALKIFEELQVDEAIGNIYNNIGNLYLIKGETHQAANYFENALKKLEESDRKSVATYNLINCLTQAGDLDKANDSLLDLKNILEKNPSKLIDLNYRLAKAYILRKSKRIIKRAEAQLIYQQVSYEPVINQEYTVDAMFNLCEMLIQELRTTGNEEIIIEVKDVISKLIEIAENQNSYKTLVQSKLLQSKIALLELDLNSAKTVLDEAQKIAFEKGLDNLALVVSGEYDILIEQLSKWTELIDSNVSMIERLEMSELEGLVSNMVRKKTDTTEFLNEIPELFIVLNDQGMKIFSKVFTAESTLDDQVVGDLLTAVNSFIQETFSASGSIERLKHKEHTLLLKPIENYLTCYVFKGQSYSALQKLEKFVDSIKEKQDLYQKIITSHDEIVNDNFSSLVSSIFTPKAQALSQ